MQSDLWRCRKRSVSSSRKIHHCICNPNPKLRLIWVSESLKSFLNRTLHSLSVISDPESKRELRDKTYYLNKNSSHHYESGIKYGLSIWYQSVKMILFLFHILDLRLFQTAKNLYLTTSLQYWGCCYDHQFEWRCFQQIISSYFSILKEHKITLEYIKYSLRYRYVMKILL